MESSSGSPSSKVSSAKPGDLTLDQLKPGYIVHLKRKNQFDSRYLALSGIDEGGLHHPALVLSTVQDTGGNGNLLHFPGRVVTCVLTTFNDREIYDAQPPSQWKNYLPIAPQRTHPMDPKKSRSELAPHLKMVSATLRKTSYVKIGVINTVHVSMLKKV
ncbi:hypothetical protein MMC09_005366 [Bachmanniomyces sp. S44760]|nr:hypothetical protein [Bachmanniomyces sp. S44760]